jgi:uncharacterized protein YxeA
MVMSPPLPPPPLKLTGSLLLLLLLLLVVIVCSDFGYERDSSNETAPCLLIDNSQEATYPPEYCPPGEKYYKTKGYRLEAGNTCTGGVDHSPEGPFDCPSDNSHSSKAWIAAVVVIPIVLVFIIFGVIALRSEKVREKLPFLKFANTWRTGYVGMQNVDEEDGTLLGEEDTHKKSEDEPPAPPKIEDDGFNPRA